MNQNQHHKPCRTCPFRRDCTPGHLGGSPVQTFIGQAFGAFWIPCHERIDYDNPDWRRQFDTPQCAGVAIYRSNAHPGARPADLLSLPADETLVFATPDEFMAHHLGISLDEATQRLNEYQPVQHWRDELCRSGAFLIPKGAVK